MLDIPMTLPPDRSAILTEQRNPHSDSLHLATVAECVHLIHREDHAVLSALAAGQSALIAYITAIETGFLAGGRVIYLGAGTSGRLGVLDASEAPPTFQVPPDRFIGIIAGGDGSLRQSSEGKEDDPVGAVPALTALSLGNRDTVLGIAAGGTTPYVQGALHWCSRLPSPPITGLLSCTPIPVPDGVHHLIVLPTGPEVLTGSTRMKAGTATKLALNTISTTLMVRSGKVYRNLMVDVRSSNAKLRDRAARIIATILACSREQAFTWLDAADGNTKTAVVMGRLQLDRHSAEARLRAVDGHLDRLLDPQ